MGIDELLARLESRDTEVTGLQHCFDRDFSVTPLEDTGLRGVTAPKLSTTTVTPVTPCYPSRKLKIFYENKDVTCVTRVTQPDVKNQRNEEAACEKCAHSSKFGNCMQPQDAGLSRTFKLIRHEQNGKGCLMFAPLSSEKPSHVFALIDEARRLQAIDESDTEAARTALARADPQDTKFVIEYESLLHACIRSLEAKTGHDA